MTASFLRMSTLTFLVLVLVCSLAASCSAAAAGTTSTLFAGGGYSRAHGYQRDEATNVGARGLIDSDGSTNATVVEVDPDVNLVPASIHYVAFGSQWVSIPGSIFIIIWTIVNRATISKKGPAHRFPLYISIADLGFTVTHFIDHMIILETGKYPPHGVCQLFAWWFQFMSIATIMNVMSVSLYCAATVIMLRRPDCGKYDWKLLAFGFGIPFLFSFVPFMTSSYGHDAAWCWIDQTKPDSHLGYIIIPYLLFLVLNILTLCVIFYAIARSSSAVRSNMIKRSILFVFSYIFQFTPIIVFSIQLYAGVVVPYNTILFVVFNTNLGGFLNVIVYGFGILNIRGSDDATGSRASQTGGGTRTAIEAGNSAKDKDKHNGGSFQEKDFIMPERSAPMSPSSTRQARPSSVQLQSPRGTVAPLLPALTVPRPSLVPSPTASGSPKDISEGERSPAGSFTLKIEDAIPSPSHAQAGGSVSPRSTGSPRRYRLRVHTSTDLAPELLNIVQGATTEGQTPRSPSTQQ